MSAELAQIHDSAETNPWSYFHMSARRVEVLRRGISTLNGDGALVMRRSLARELMNAGRNAEAIEVLEDLIDESVGFAMTAERKTLLMLLGTANLRLGMQENAPSRARSTMNILPLEAESLHVVSGHTQRASEIFGLLLEQSPEDLQARWLLNISRLLLGTYQGLAPETRIPGFIPRAPALFPHFENAAPRLGIDVEGTAGGVSMDDFNGDGELDIITTSYGLRDPVRLFLSDGQGGFMETTRSAGLDGITGGLGVAHADYDNDGDLDVLILRGAWLGDQGTHPNSLLRNRGDGTFEDVTRQAGILSYHPTQVGAWGDFDNDGWVDLFVGNEWSAEGRNMGASPGTIQTLEHPSELFRNNGDGSFTDIAVHVGLDVTAFIKGAAWGDVDNDGWPDLYVSVLGGPNRLYMNRQGSARRRQFEDVAAAAGVEQPVYSFSVWFWDFDQNGWDDLFVASFDPRGDILTEVARELLGRHVQSEHPRIYRNNGDGTFQDVSVELGVYGAFHIMGANYGDLNNDGFPDMYLGTGDPNPWALVPNRMFLNKAGRNFEEVTLEGGFGDLGKGHGVAFGDVDGNGFQDVYAVMGGALEGDQSPNVLFLNPGVQSDNAWIKFCLEGRTANRAGIGARIRIVTRENDNQQRTVFKTLSTGGSFGASSLRQEVGLGSAERIERLEIRWPNKASGIDAHLNLSVRQHYHFVEGEVEPLGFRSDSLWN